MQESEIPPAVSSAMYGTTVRPMQNLKASPKTLLCWRRDRQEHPDGEGKVLDDLCKLGEYLEESRHFDKEDLTSMHEYIVCRATA